MGQGGKGFSITFTNNFGVSSVEVFGAAGVEEV